VLALVLLAAPARANVTLNKTAVGPAAIGGQVQYQIVVNRTANETGLVVTDPLPANHQLLSVQVPGGQTVDCTQTTGGPLAAGVTAICGGGNLQVNVADFPTGPQNSVQLIVTYRVTGPSSTNVAHANCAQAASCPAQSPPASATVSPAQLTFAKNANPSQVSPGGQFTYTLTVTNNSPSDLVGIEIKDPLPAGVTVGTIDSPVPATVTNTGGVVDIKPAVLPKGPTTFTLHATLGLVAAAPTNTATVTAMSATPVSASATLSLGASGVSKIASPSTIAIGGTVTYTITVQPQPGPLTLVDPLDPSLKLTSIAVDKQPVAGCGPQAQPAGAFSVTCGTNGQIALSLPAGQTLDKPSTLTLQAIVQPTAPPQIQNVATLTGASGGAQQSSALVTVTNGSTAASLSVTAGKTLAEKADLVPFVVAIGIPSAGTPVSTPFLILSTTRGLRVGDVRLTAPGGAMTLVRPVEANGVLQVALPPLPAGATLSAQVRTRVNDRATIGLQTLGAQLTDGANVLASGSANVRVIADPEFDLATLIGDVFRDDNGNGVRDRGERGVEGATVVMDDGLQAVTDAEGHYHLAAIRPGERAIKCAKHTLPPGARFTTDETRIYPVTAGSLIKIDFGIKVPALEAPLKRPPRGPPPHPELTLLKDGRLGYRLGGQAEPGARVLVDGKEAQLDRKSGAWTIDVALSKGRNRFAQVTAWPDGRVVVASRDVYWVERAGGDALIVPRDEEDRLVLQFPAAPLAEPTFTLEGLALAPLASLTVAGAPLVPDARGRLILKLRLPEGGAGIAVEASFADGLVSRFDHVQSAGGDFFLLVGLVEGKTGYVQRSGAATSGDSGVFAEGRVKLYTKGRIEGRWLLEGALDIDSTQIDSWRDLFRGDPSRVFRNLDPDRFYPVYGDSSSTTAQAQTRGRLYVGIKIDRSELVFGNLQTGLTGVEYGRYSRAVTGGRIHYVRASVDDPNGPPTTEVIVFGAWLETARAHDELRGTGGSLYYLSHRSVVEGSEQVRVEIRDQISNRPVANVAQRATADYEIDYLAGRLALRDPLLSVSSSTNLIRSSTLDGDSAFLIVDYEYVVDGDLDEGTVGGRVVQRLGPVRLGGTAVHEILNGPSYTLLGGDLQLDLQKWGVIIAEYAHSYGALLSFYRSDDGGLTYANSEGATQLNAAKREGNAWKAEADLHGWGVIDFHPYARGVDQGYTDTAHGQDAGYLQYGAKVGIHIWRLQLQAHYDEQRWDQQQLDATGQPLMQMVPDPSNPLQMISQPLVLHQIRRDAGGELTGAFGSWGWRVGARSERADDDSPQRAGHRSTVGARVDWAVVPRLALYGAGQYAVEHGGGDGLLARDNSLGALGMIVDLGWNTKLTAEGSYGAQGAGGLASLKSDLGQGRVVYGTVTLSQDREDRLISTVAAGGRVRILDNNGKARALLFAEDQFRDGPVGPCTAAYTLAACDGAGRAHVLATGLDVPLGKRFVFGATFERGEIQQTGTPFSPGANQPIDQIAGTAYASYGGDRFRAQAKGEVRSTSQELPPLVPNAPPPPTLSALQWLASGMMTWRPLPDFTLRGKVFYSRSTDPSSSTLARSAETTVGFAWRPSFTDRIALLGRYTFLDEFAPLGQAQNGPLDPITGRPLSNRERSQVMSLGADGRIFWRFSLGEKIAAKYMEEPTLGTAEWFILWVNRLSFHVTRRWDAVLEYRLLSVPGETLTQGVSLEGNVIIVGHLRLGAGWNFADFGDNELTLGRGSEKGFFVRAEGFY
jgi:uncharacterized repeat protein (TIGR01451 family)